MGLQEQGWLMDGVRSIFGFLDNLVYSLIKWILFGIFDLANLSTNSNVFSGIYSRIYVILGIFMAFKLSFAFFKYIIDPESMTGKSDTSLTKLLSRTIIMLAALIFLPTVLFGQNGNEGLLARAQRAFLPSLPKIIFGVNNIGGISSTPGSNTTQAFTDSIEQSANDIAVTTLGGFFNPPEELDDVCGKGTIEKTPPIKSLDEFMANLKTTCNKKGEIHIDLLIAHTGTRFYKYSYMWFVSTVVGVLIAALLLGITLGIAKRIFKLMILEVIAPIPIMSLIDPKGNKDGAFAKWSKSLISTFGDIFMKLGLVYMIIVFIHLIVNTEGGLFSNFPKENGFRGTYLTILLILGLIFFAKEAPKFIKESLGFKGDGGGLLDDVKSVGKAAGLVGGAAIGTVGTLGSTIGSIRAQHQGNKAENDALRDAGITPNLGHHLLHGARNIMAGISGYAGGSTAAMKALTKKDAGIKSVMKAQQERNARDFEYRRNGGTFFGGLGSAASDLMLGSTPYDALDLRLQNDEEKVKRRETALKPKQDANAHRKAIMDRVNSKAVESEKTSGSFGGITGNYRAYNSAFTAAKSGIGLSHKYIDASGNIISQADYSLLSSADQAKYTDHTYFNFNGQDVDMSEADSIALGLLDANKEDYYRQAYSDRSFDNAISNEIDLFNEAGMVDSSGNPIEIESTLGGVKAKYGSDSASNSREANEINREKQRIYEEKQGFEAQRRKSNSGKYKAGSKK